ncbi:DUF2206 domain-containing protein, partial [Dehalococcoidia bacterium]|nr:DUF2206 domain-containing protein [Dehalococcoidia bacterium]
MAFVVFLLSGVAYFKDKEYDHPDFIDLSDLLSPQFLSLSLIPFMAILGTYLVNYYQDNILLMFMIGVIALVALVIGFTDWIPVRLYPYAIWVISIALLLHICLISPYLIINDVMVEYYIATTVANNNYWAWYDINPMHLASNTVLSVTILPPMIHHIMNINLMWVFKLVLPLIYSFLPLVLYFVATYIHKDIFRGSDSKSARIAFMSPLLFMAIFDFIRIATITKQAIAMLFFALLIHLIIKGGNTLSTKFLTLFFIGGLITAHYGLAYLFGGMMIFTYVITKVWNILFKIDNYHEFHRHEFATMVFLVGTIGWYMHISQAVAFDQVINILHFVSISFQEYLFDPYAARGLFLLARELPTISSQITRNILIFIVLIIFLGYFAWIFELLKAKKPQLKDIIFFGFVSSWLTILGASVLAAGFAAMDPRRLFQTGLIILGIFAVMGGCRLFSFILRNKVEVNTNLVGAIFVTLMLFSGTGFIQEILDDTPSSIAISQQSIFEGNHPISIMRF